MLSQLKSKLKNLVISEHNQALVLACRDYEERSPGLGSQVADYILTGKSVGCLSQLEQLTQANSLSLPGIYVGEDGRDDSVYQAMIQFLTSSAAQTYAVMRRLGLVCQACWSYEYILDVNTTVPGWLAHVLKFWEQYTLDFQHMDVVPPWIPTRAKLMALAREYDQPDWYIDAFILEGYDSGYCNSLRSILIHHTDWLEVALEQESSEKLARMHFTARQAIGQLLARESALPTTLIPLLMTLATDSSLNVRTRARQALLNVADEDKLLYLREHFPEMKSASRLALIDVASDISGSTELMQEWLAVESIGSVLDALHRQLGYKDPHPATTEFSWDLPTVPEFEFVTDIPEAWYELCDAAKDALIQETKESIQEKKALIEQEEQKTNYREKTLHYYHQQYKEDCAELKILESLAGSNLKTVLQRCANGLPVEPLLGRMMYYIVKNAKILNRSDATIGHFIRLCCETWPDIGWGNEWDDLFNNDNFCRMLKQSITDIRQLEHLTQLESLSARHLARILLQKNWRWDGNMPPALSHVSIWPLFAEHPEFIADGLQGEGAECQNLNAETLRMLLRFDTISPQWIDKIYKHALGRYKIPRHFAQQVVEKFCMEPERILPGLAATSKDSRMMVAMWLSQLKLPQAVVPLTTAINKEKDIATRAVLLDALEASGGDISEFLSAEALSEEATLGLKKAVPKSMQWLDKTRLPACTFADGTPVNPDIIYWWAVLAVKLKQPEGNRLFELYLTTLSEKSRRQLGDDILAAFITQDTLCPSDQDAHEYAEARKHHTYEYYQSWSKYEPEYAERTLEYAYQVCFRARKNELLGSAIKDKGLLALIRFGDANQLLVQIQRFMKDFHVRRAQIEAMLLAIGHSDEPVIIQFMLSLARRYRTNSIQELARTLVEHIAERNGWTPDELADRTIPTAGLDNLQGATSFEYGSRTLAIQLTDDLKFQLLNDDGKILKSLPQPRKDDNSETISEAKKWFNNCKKELKQVVSQQSTRLYEAMVTERHWSAGEWQQYLHQHPVMFRLLQRTLWQVRSGKQWLTFRPTEDGDVIDIEDDDVVIAPDATIRLLSGNQLNEDARKSWLAHLKDYKVKPLFEQLRQAHCDIQPGQEIIDHYKGRMTESYRLRGMLKKKGYQHGEADEGYFDCYCKSFESLSLRIEFEFSGEYLGEPNSPVAIYGIRVVKRSSNSRSWYACQTLPLSDVPPNLLNAIALDYEDVAKKCTQDPDWKKKITW